MSRIRERLTYANVMSTLAVVIALGGTATAAVIVSSNNQIAGNTISGHQPPQGDHPNIIQSSINGKDVARESLTGADIANDNPEGTGSPPIQTCQPVRLDRYGRICADDTDAQLRDWFEANDYCAARGLRLPSPGEAYYLANNFAIDGYPTDGIIPFFYTDDLILIDNAFYATAVLDREGQDPNVDWVEIFEDSAIVVCVTDPSA
jgi:hypothetical protein